MIPNNIILTYKKKEYVPSYVFENLKNLNPDKDILFFSDEDVKKFLLEEYDSSYVDFFNGVRLGCTKGDFFRYCYLLKYGGYYCDIDIQHLEPIKNYVFSDTEFFSVNASVGQKTFQAFLYSEKDHPIIKNCLKDLMNPESAKDYYYKTTDDMYKNIKSYLGLGKNEKINSGIHKTKNDTVLRIGQEICINANPVNGPLNSFFCLFGNRIIASSRYPSYKTEQGFKDI
jgi:mannosyltransferase OCH1-like enzyme